MNRNRDERLQIMLEPEELRALDDFRFKFRMPSRAAAVRELLSGGSPRPLRVKLSTPRVQKISACSASLTVAVSNPLTSSVPEFYFPA